MTVAANQNTSTTGRKVFKHFSIYSGAGFLNRAIPLLLLPILTRYLSPEDYGLLATFTAALSLLNILIGMGGTDAITRGYFDRNKEGFSFSQYLFNVLLVNLGAFIIVMLAVVGFQTYLVEKFSIPAHDLLLLPVLGLWMTVYMIPCKLFVFRQAPASYAGLETARTLSEIVLSILFVVFLKMNWQGRVGGLLISQFLFFLLGIFLIGKLYRWDPTYHWDYVKRILSFGAPVVFHSLGFTLIVTMDRFFLNRLVGLSAVGIYSVGSSLAAVLAFGIGAFNLAWSPMLYQKLENADDAAKNKLVAVTYSYFAGICVLAVLLIVTGPWALKVLAGPAFHGAAQVVPWLAMGYAVHGMYTMVVDYIFYQRKTYLLSLVAVLTVIVSVVFNMVLIPLNGAVGAAQAVFFTFFSRFLLVWYFSNKVYPMPWFSFFKMKKILPNGPQIAVGSPR